MTQATTAPEWLTIAEVAVKLNLSKMTVYRMINSKELPAFKFGRAYRVKPSQLEEFIQKSQIS